MKLSLLCTLSVFSILLFGCAAKPPVTVTPPPTKDWTITATFQYNFTNFVPCSTTVTAGCVSGFQWGYNLGSGNVVLKTSPVTVCSGTTQPETCTDTANSTLGIGNYSGYVIANGVNNAGAVVASSTDVSPTYSTSIAAPTNLTLTAQ